MNKMNKIYKVIIYRDYPLHFSDKINKHTVYDFNIMFDTNIYDNLSKMLSSEDTVTFSMGIDILKKYIPPLSVKMAMLEFWLGDNVDMKILIKKLEDDEKL